MSDLELAWNWRSERGIFSESEAVRVFHGPGEGYGVLQNFAVDRFGSHYWITEWEGKKGPLSPDLVNEGIRQIVEFLRKHQATSAVVLRRPEKGLPHEPKVVFGNPPDKRFDVKEGDAKFRIELIRGRHPGLFLDHAPLRKWLRARSAGWKVLNTFAYTGSLSVAAGLGGAKSVTTLDLAKPAIQWAEENWKANALAADTGRFIAGDVFEWLPKLKAEGQVFDCVILDPPSFSRGNKGVFTTSKDLKALHQLALDLIGRTGVLVTSINSANVSWQKYEADLLAAARAKSVTLDVLSQLGLPETFPTRFGQPMDRYLKGWIFRARR